MPAAIWALSWPVMIESVLSSLVGLTDTVLAAGIEDGGAAADAIGGASYVLWFFGLIVAALGVGATALIARSVGKRRLAIANAGLTQTVVLAAASGIVIAGCIAFLSPLAAGALNMSPDAKAAFQRYMAINAFGFPASSVLFAAIACVRGAGDSRSPLAAMTIVNFINIGASWALAGVDLKTTAIIDGEPVTRVILHNPFGFNLGVAGIAWGTVLSQFAGAAFMLAVVLRGVGGVRLVRHRLRPHVSTIARLARVGWPNFLETFGMWVGNFLVLLLVGLMGPGALGAHVVAIRIEAFSFLPGFALGSACATLVGQYLGAGSPALARRAVVICSAAASLFMGVCGMVFVLAPERVVGLMTSQAAHLELAPGALFAAGCIQIPFAIQLVVRAAVRGAGDVRAAMWITWICTYAVRLPLAWLLSGVDVPMPGFLGGGVLPNPAPESWGLAGLWWGLCLEIVVRFGAFTWRFAGGKWAHARV